MQEYRIKPGGFKEIRKQILVRIIPITVIAGSVGILIGLKNETTQQYGINPLFLAVPFIALVLVFSILRAIKRQKTLFESYKLTIDGNMIKREQINTQTISLYFNEISQIKKNVNGGFIIRGKNNWEKILIPAQIEDYLQLEDSLSTIMIITQKTPLGVKRIFVWLLAIFTIAAMVCVYTSNNKLVVAISGVFLMVILSWGFIDMRKNKNIDAKTKRGSIWILLIIIMIITIVVYKLTGFKI